MTMTIMMLNHMVYFSLRDELQIGKILRPARSLICNKIYAFQILCSFLVSGKYLNKDTYKKYI